MSYFSCTRTPLLCHGHALSEDFSLSHWLVFVTPATDLVYQHACSITAIWIQLQVTSIFISRLEVFPDSYF